MHIIDFIYISIIIFLDVFIHQYDVTPILGTEIRSTDKVVMSVNSLYLSATRVVKADSIHRLLGRVGSGKSNVRNLWFLFQKNIGLIYRT